MPGCVGERALLAPARHAPVDEGRVEREARVGPEPEPLGDSGPVALDEDVGARDEGARRLEAVGVLEVEHDRGAAATQQVRLRGHRHGLGLRPRPVEPDDVGAQVGEQHAREW